MARKPASTTTPSAGIDKIRVIYGPEDMLKRESLDQLRAEIDAAHGPTDIFTFDGKAAALADVLDELRSFSLLQQHKLVIVDDADVFVSAHREALVRYAQNPVESATLVLRSTKWNRGNLDKMIEKVGRLIKCEPLSPADARAWLQRRAQTPHAVKIEPQAAQLLADRLGSNLMQLDTELAKLAVLAGPGTAISAVMVEQVVGRSSDEEAWAVQEAILEAMANPVSPSSGGDGHVLLIEKIHEIVDLAGQPEILVAYFIADLIRNLYMAMMMKREGAPDGQIAGSFRLWGRRQANFMRIIGQLSPDTAGRMFDRIVELDVRSKTGRGEPLRNLECFCALLAAGSK